jgi:hypothetical protein
LVAFRVGLALVVLIDLADRARDLVAHYTDAGVLPVSVLANVVGASRSSLYALSGSSVFVAGLFVIAAVAASFLLVGVGARLAAALSWLLLVSLQARNPLVLHFGDTLLRVLLFWAMFLPLERGGETPRRSVAAAALKLQVAFVYWFAAAWKTGDDWWQGTAVYYALSYGFVVRPFGRWLLGMPSLIAPLTYGTLIVEALGPFLLLVPERRWRVRAAAVATFVAMHVLFGLTMDLGTFPLAGIVGMLPFIPERMWGPDTAPAAAPTRRRIDRVLGQLVPVPFLLLVTYYNVAGLPWTHAPRPSWVASLTSAAHLEQRWAMFAPGPSRDDGWFVVAGTLADGRVLPVPVARPDDPRVGLPSQRWRLYMVSLTRETGLTALPAYAAYVCRTRGLRTLQLHFELADTPPPSATGPVPVQDRLIWDAPCPTAGG